MITIRDESDLRIAWQNIFMINDLQKEYYSKGGDDLLKQFKIAIRDYYKSQASRPERRYFDCDSFDYYRCFGVTDYTSVEEAEEYYVPLSCYPDQLGRWFEISHKFFKRSDGKVCGYFFMGMNV